jgi:hypothetical protein
VSIASNKPFIQLMGESLAETIISYDNYSGKAISAGGTYGTSTCGTVIINANDVMLMNLSIENATGYGINANALVPAPGDGPQAVAVYTTSDRVVFYNCRMNGGQDTYYGGNNRGTRCYFKNCYVDGNTDFLFGSSTIIFDTCIIYPRTRLDNQTGGYVTAVNTQLQSGYGYVFRDCKITRNRGFTLYSLGRPWQNDGTTADAAKSRNKTVFLNTLMGSTIRPDGWSTWDGGTNTSFITYGEYNSKNYNGTPVNVNSRVAWSKQLTAADATKYYNNDTVFMNANTPIMTKWDPFATWPELNTAFIPELSISNLIAKKGTGTTTVTWNMSWPMTGITCDLYRSTDKTNFTLINSQVSTEDSAGNFNFTENVPPPGQTYYYIVRSSKSGANNSTSDTASVTSKPTITVFGSLGSFLQGLGKSSKAQTYIVAGANLVNNLTITPPAGYQVSIDNTNWNSSNTPISITPANGTVANTTVYVRLNGVATGTFNGNIVNASTNATAVNVGVAGTIQADPLTDGILLEQWLLTANNQDDATVRASGIIGTTPVLNKLVLSTDATVPAYSTLHGQAYASTADGSWATTSGGPGAALNWQFYEQFTVVAANTHTMRVDSIILSTSFYNTSSGTKMAVAYSKTGFRNDSTEISVVAKNGTPLTAAANGNFKNSFDVSNQTGGNPDVFALLPNGSVGVSVKTGDTLSFRIYHCTSSGSAVRFVKLKNVIVKGAVIKNAVTPVITTSGVLKPFSQTVGKPTDGQTFTLSATSLGSAVTMIPPAGYELSVDTGKTWNAASIVLPANVNKALSASVIVRLNASAAGPYEGNVEVQADGSTGINVPVTGVAYSPYTINPNPAHNSVNIYHAKLYTQANIRIYNLNGYQVKMVRTKRAANFTTINISDLPGGIYFVVVERLNERILLKFIKQ